MNRLLIAVLTGLLCSWQSLPVEAATVDCVPHEGCPKDASSKKKKCCTLPKCEFFYALVLARAELDAYQGDFLMPLVGSPTNRQVVNQHLRGALSDARANNRRCPPKDFYIEPPILQVSSAKQCAIESSEVGGSRSIDFEEFQLRSNTCAEIVEAAWAQAEQEQFYCNRPYQPDPERDIETFRKRNEAAARAKVRSLEDSLLQYRRVCTKVSDAKIGRRVAKLGLKALKDDFKKKPKSKKKAKRSGQAR